MVETASSTFDEKPLYPVAAQLEAMVETVGASSLSLSIQ